jgi:hypothetical protein
MNDEGPNTREVLLLGLQAALQQRVAQIWTNVTQKGETQPEKRFAEGVRSAAAFYEQAWKAIEGEFK